MMVAKVFVFVCLAFIASSIARDDAPGVDEIVPETTSTLWEEMPPLDALYPAKSAAVNNKKKNSDLLLSSDLALPSSDLSDPLMSESIDNTKAESVTAAADDFMKSMASDNESYGDGDDKADAGNVESVSQTHLMNTPPPAFPPY